MPKKLKSQSCFKSLAWLTRFSHTKPEKSAEGQICTIGKSTRSLKKHEEKKLKQFLVTMWGAELWANHCLNTNFVGWKFSKYVEMEETQKP